VPQAAAAAAAAGQAAAAVAQRGATGQGAPAATGGVRGVVPTRPSARGTQHVKPLQNLPGELNKTQRTFYSYPNLRKLLHLNKSKTKTKIKPKQTTKTTNQIQIQAKSKQNKSKSNPNNLRQMKSA